MINDYLSIAAEQAAASAGTALDVLAEIMADVDQTGPVRVAAAKAVVDFALKLHDQEGQGDGSTLAKLDEVLAELRAQAETDYE